MRKFLILLAILFGCALPAAAQFTVVTGTVTDVNGLPYVPGTISASLVVPGGCTPTLNGGGFTGSMSPIGLNSTGSFTARLADNNVISCGGVTGTTSWKFLVNSIGAQPPVGTGPQTCTATVLITGASQSVTTNFNACPALSNSAGGISQVTVNPATCTTGQIFFNTVTGQLLLCTTPNALSTASGAPATTIDMKQYGVVADLRTCIGTALTITNGSPIVTCTTGNFCNGSSVACPAGQTSDVGKRFNATAGCCNNSVPVNTNTQIVPNNATILSVQSATQITLTANATGTPTPATTAYAFWATDDDAAVTAADTAYANSPVCSALLFPATPFLIKNPHFNSPGGNCEQLESSGGVGRLPTGSYVGWGSNNSVFYLDSTFPQTACGTSCLFNYVGPHLQHFGISGGWNQVPNGGGHTYTLINCNSCEVTDLRTVGFSAGDGTTLGWAVGSFSNLTDVFEEGFGFNGLLYNGQSTAFRGGYFGNNQGVSGNFQGSPGVSSVQTYNVQFGTSGNSTVQLGGGPWISNGDLIYGNPGTCLNAQATPNVSAFFIGTTFGSNGACGTAFLVTSGTLIGVQNSQINATTTYVNLGNGSTFIDECGNTWTGAGTLTIGATATFIPCPNPLGTTYATAPAAGKLNCASSAAPAVCGAYATGSVVIAAAATTVTVNTTAITANSEVILTPDDTLGTKLGVTCNSTIATLVGGLAVTSRTAGTSFQVTSGATPAVNPLCFNYEIRP